MEDRNIPSTNLLQELENWAIVEDMSQVPRNLQDTAVNRWIVTASMKSKILNAVLDYTDTNISYDESKELSASRIRAEQNHLSKFEKILKATENSFSKQLKDFLINIKNGTQASKDVEKYLVYICT